MNKQILFFLIIFGVIFVLSGCRKDQTLENVDSLLLLDKYYVTINMSIATNTDVEIKSGNGSYKLVISPPSIITASLSNNMIAIHAQSKGRATITVMDSKGEEAYIYVTVLQSTDNSDDSLDNNYITLSHVYYDKGILYIASKFDDNRDLHIWFKKCMFNNLMTFFQVALEDNPSKKAVVRTSTPSTILNIATSDNIGPITLLSEDNKQVRFGGNHSFREEGKLATAYNESYEFYADGELLKPGMLMYAQQIKVVAVNRLYDPLSAIFNNGEITGFKETMCRETVEYFVEEGNIEVNLTHEWYNETTYDVHHYYGMQSMASSRADSVFFTRGANNKFQLKTEIRGNKGQYPTFDRFVQKNSSNTWYESCYLTNDGIGDHSLVHSDELIYLNATTQKTYHSLITQKTGYKLSSGDSYSWRGIYTWMVPITDNDNILTYIIKSSSGYILIADVKSPGEFEITLPDKIILNDIEVLNNDDFSIQIQSSKVVKINANRTGSWYIRIH